jgi:hypothetical protein
MELAVIEPQLFRPQLLFQLINGWFPEGRPADTSMHDWHLLLINSTKNLWYDNA